jgi:tetratricopeptide (TPR) repeat protein
LDDKRYWAFLSYSHADRAWAGWLHRALETYPVPRRLRGRPTPFGPTPRRFSPIFRDREELAADAHLLARIQEVLRRSAYLIVLCSPAAARSSWVNQEIVHFKRLYGEDRVLAVIVAGAPRGSETPGREDEECFPPALRVRVGPDGALTGERADPLAADLRPGQDGRRLARLKLLARMLEVGLDDLVRRDAQRRQSRLLVATAVMTAVAALTSGLAVVAVAERNEAIHQRGRAEGLVEFMLGDLTKKLKPTGRLDLLDAVGAEALHYYSAEARHGLDADALGRRARVLHLLGDLRDQRGDLAGATDEFRQAAKATALLLAADPRDPTRIFNHAQSLYYLGDTAKRRGQMGEAETAFFGYRRLALELVKIDPRRDDWRAEVAYANENLGSLWVQEDKADEAAAAFAQALGVEQELAAKEPNDRDRQTDLADVYGLQSNVDISRHRWQAAEHDLMAERAIYLRLLARQPADNLARLDLVTSGARLGNAYAKDGRAGDAVRALSEATRQAEDLLRLEPDNTDGRERASEAFVTLARARLAAGDPSGAGAAASRGLALAEGLMRKDSKNAYWRGFTLGGARVVAARVAAARARTGPALAAALQPALAEGDRLSALSATDRPNVPLARVAADAQILAGGYEALSGHADLARQRWAKSTDVCHCQLATGFGRPPTGQISLGALDDSLDRLKAIHGRSAPTDVVEGLKADWMGTDLW